MAGVIAVISPERRIKQNPFDVEAWTLLLRDAQRKKIDVVRPFYEALVKQFPNAGRFWKAYAEQEIASGNTAYAEAIFQRCLVKVLNIDLWKCYLKYVRTTKGNSASFREKMAEVYDFALEKVGLDFQSSQIYSDYISFLKGVPATGSYAENQKISAIRKVYHRAIATPMIYLEQIWMEYCAYEKSVNQFLADKLINDKSREYQQSRRVSRMMEAVTRGLNRNLVSVPPRNTPQEIRQHRLWKAFIKWETSNPLQTDDQTLLIKRVIFAYEQALLCLGFHSDLWYEASLYMQESSRRLLEKGDSKFSHHLSSYTTALMDRAISFVWTNNILLNFAYADYEEERMHFEKVHTLYKNLLDNPRIDPTLTYVQYMRFMRRREGIMGARAVFKKAREDARCTWHIYVAAAQMEFACTKDPTVSKKIYEMAMKKYPYECQVALAYVDMLISLNDKESVRELFERVLSSHVFPLDKVLNVWEKYLDYESYVGDSQRVRELHRRRHELVQQRLAVGRTAVLIDQYRHDTLLPCDMDQLPLAGFMKLHLPNNKALAGIKSKMPQWMLDPCGCVPKPALEGLAPFKPKLESGRGGGRPGFFGSWSDHGCLALSPVLLHLMSIIPPVTCFAGPLVDVDRLLDRYQSIDMAQVEVASWASDAEKESFIQEMQREFKNLVTSSVTSSQQLYRCDGDRKPMISLDDDSDEESANMIRPTLDIYRMRKQQKSAGRL